jgi:subfamily B ATP-binding cassette protein MsbA
MSRAFLSTYRRLLRVVRPETGRLCLALGCMLVLAAATGAYAYLIGPVLKFLVTGGQGAGALFAGVPGLDAGGLSRERLITLLPLVILGVAVVKGLAYFGQFFLMGQVGQRVVADLRARMFARLCLQSPAFFQQNATGPLISRFTSDVLAVEQAVTYALASYLRDSLQIVVLTALAFVLDWRLALIAFVAMPAAVVPIVHFGRRIKRVSTDSQESLGRIADRLHEGVQGMRIVQVFGAEAHEQARFQAENLGYLRIMLRSFAARALQSPVMEFLGAAGLAALIAYAGGRVVAGSLDGGHFVSFFAAVLMLYAPLKSLGRIGNETAAGVAGAERVFALLDEPIAVEDAPGAVELPPFQAALAFEDVRFAYRAEEVLRGVSLVAHKGEVLALVGPSGAGKSTLVSLIPRFHDPTAGRVTLDGRDLRAARLASLRAQIGLVTQETILFNDTVRNNIAYPPRSGDEARLREAARRARALEFIEALPGGFEARIGEGGILLSGGQRQRIAIARALMKDAPILLLDEATSALDTESEREVQAALEELMRDRTVLVVAHRLSTIYRADRILVLDGGRIVEEGTHQALLAQGGLYRHLYDLQFEDLGPPGPLSRTAGEGGG